jgi:hypothetical protein
MPYPKKQQKIQPEIKIILPLKLNRHFFHHSVTVLSGLYLPVCDCGSDWWPAVPTVNVTTISLIPNPLLLSYGV